MSDWLSADVEGLPKLLLVLGHLKDHLVDSGPLDRIVDSGMNLSDIDGDVL